MSPSPPSPESTNTPPNRARVALLNTLRRSLSDIAAQKPQTRRRREKEIKPDDPVGFGARYRARIDAFGLAEVARDRVAKRWLRGDTKEADVAGLREGSMKPRVGVGEAVGAAEGIADTSRGAEGAGGFADSRAA